MNENENNNKLYEDLKLEFEILKRENEIHKENIKNLNAQLYIMKEKQKETMKEISELKEYYKQQFEQLINIIITQKEQLDKDKNEIIIEKKNDSIIDIKENHIKIDKKDNQKIENKKDNSLKKAPKGKDKKNEEYISIEIVFNLFETKLFKIFEDDSPKIDKNDVNDIKKLSIALIIKGGNPTDIVADFFEKNLNNNVEQFDENIKIKNEQKKSDIFLILEDLHTFSLKDKIEKKFIDAFIQGLREKCGITEEDINDKDLKKEIKNNKNDPKKIINIILQKTKLFQEK